MSNTITAYFKGRIGVAEAVYQNDYGIVMAFDSIDLPAHFDCYFSKLNQEEALPGVGADNMVAIPNSVLADPGNVTIHIPLHAGENDSEVEYVVYFKVIGRARPIDDGTPTQMTAIEQALALLQTPITNIEEIVNEALAFTGETFEEMQEDLDEWKTGVESDFDNLDAQFQTAVSALTVDSEVQNIRVGDDDVTYTSAGDAVRTQFHDVKSAINEISTLGIFRSSQKINKGINGVTFLLEDRTGNTTITNNTLICAEHDLVLNVESGYMYVVATFTSGVWTTENHISNTAWQYGEYLVPQGTWFTVQIMKADRSAFANGEADKVVVTIKDLVYSDDLAVTDLNKLNSDYALRRAQRLNYVINGVTFLLEEQRMNNTITTTKLLYANHKTICKVESGYKYIVATYTSDVWTTENHIANTAWQTGEYIIPKGTYYAIQLRRSDNSAFAHLEADKYVFTLQELAYLDDLGEKPTLYHILVTGQSLGVGAEGNPALTTTTPYEYIGKAYQFNGGSRPIDGMENDTGVEEIAILDKCLDYFGSLCEETHILNLGSGQDARHAYQGETISSAMGYWFNKLTNKKVLVSNHAFGGKSYNGLKKGSIAYGNSIRAVHHAKAICDQLGWGYVVYAVAVVHGEADLSGGVSAETYKGYLNQWQSDYDGDIKAITGQTQDVQMFVSQTAAASSYGLSESPVPNGVFLASIENANIHLVAPQYCYPITYASIHMNNRGYRALGEFFGFHIGRKFNKVFNTCLYPIKSELDNTKITLTFNDGVTIVYDGNFATPVSDGHWGFELIDNESNATITNVAIVNNKVEITLSAVPSSNAHISYAYKVLSDEIGKIGYQNGVRGNLRNTFAFDSLFSDVDTVAPQWCAIFSIPVSWQA